MRLGLGRLSQGLRGLIGRKRKDAVVEWGTVVAAIITGGSALLGIVWQSRKTRRINSEEHNFNTSKLDSIATKIDKVDFRTDRIEAKLEDHLESHKHLP